MFVPGVAAGIWGLTRYDPVFTVLVPTALAVLIVIPPIAWRIWVVKTVFRTGVRLRGRATFVEDKETTLQLDHLSFTYQHQGRSYRRKKWILFSSPDIGRAQEVTIILDPERPARAFVWDLYF